jgi:Cd2+/Zn2+-exporting ATPase
MAAKVTPYILDEYVASGYEESENPFITKNSRALGKYTALLSALFATFFLAVAYTMRFFYPDLASFFLLFVYFLAGTPSLIRSLEDLKDLNINIQVLMTLAAFLSVLIGSEIEGGLLLVLFALSGALEESVTKKTKGALHALHKLSPTIAHVVEKDGTVYPKSVKEVVLGEKVLVKAGEIVPLDGVVVEGSSYVNLSHLTGESVPVSKKIGDEVQAGSHNSDGTITLTITKTSAESTLAKIIRLITSAAEAKPRLQKLLDQFGRQYAIIVILLSALFATFIPLFFGLPYLGPSGSIYRALSFLIAASPCALIIATPTAYLSAISSCARKGILLKGGIVLDAMAKCRALAFDKTGTLTTGRLSCAKVDSKGSLPLEEGLAIAAGLERAVVHPIAEAILSYAKKNQLSPHPIEDLKILPGRGVEGFIINGKERSYAVIGNPSFILEKITDPKEKEAISKMITQSGHLVTLLLVKETIFIFHFLDEIRPGMEKIVHALKKYLKISMLTGDHIDNAAMVGKKLAIQDVHANLKPEDKLRVIKELAEKDPLIMIGDGINDAPALTQAMVGIAMGEVGSATAIEAADIVLLRDDLALLPWLLKKSKKTTAIVKQNLALSLLVILVATTTSLLGLIPLWLAVILHEGSTVAVGCNSLRLLK